MKQWSSGIKGFVLGVCTTLLLLGATVAYAAESTQIEVYFKNLRYMFDGVEKKTSDLKGFIYEGSTYVPLRFVGESLGKEVSWQEETQTIWIGEQPLITPAPTTTPAPATRGVSLTSLTVSKQDEASSLAVNSWSGGGFNTAASKSFNIKGQEYKTGLGVYLNHTPYPPYIRTGGTAQFQLEGKYTRLHAVVGAAASTSKPESVAAGTLTIIGDGKELQTIFPIVTGQDAQQLDVDITGVQELRIQFNSSRHGSLNLILADPQLTPAVPEAIKEVQSQPVSDVFIVTRNRKAEYVALKNRGKQSVDLKGWTVISTAGGQSYTFQESFVLGPDSYVFLTSGSEGDSGKKTDFQNYARTLVWSTASIWNDQKEDNAQLLDASGKLVSEYQ
ncbi:lamin tail domain-containing protein [Paenibacillus koleovorans]|uniref:lamin tail domain-containing protein n=1 Tax=Paenibacillus koleovorans TaxID=121608 RepID=UPI000FD70FE0|nr:lamin tail domain-containing protein [Paenibacillus koleovorans]